jgi:hypothetical protein
MRIQATAAVSRMPQAGGPDLVGAVIPTDQLKNGIKPQDASKSARCSIADRNDNR